MSKTFKTAPLWVRANNTPGGLEPVHHHENGRECDLPVKPVMDHEMYHFYKAQHCTWQPSTAFMFSGSGVCACSRCSSPLWQKLEKRRARHAGHEYARTSWRSEY